MAAVFAWISAVTDRCYSLTSRTERDAIAKSRQSQRRAVSVRNQVEEVVVRVKELRLVVAGARAAATAEVALRFDARPIASRNVVGDQIDNRFQSMGVQSFDELPEFGEPLGGIYRVVRADIEVILDRVRAASESLQQIGVVSRLTKFGIISRGRLLQNAGQPNVAETHPAD